MSKSSVFFGGMPTKMDVDKLMALDVKPGDSVTYDQVADIIGVKHGTNRFRTVTNAWRRRLMRQCLLQTTAFGGAFHILTADEAQDKCKTRIPGIGRAVRRTRIDLEAINTNELTTAERRDNQNLLRRATEAIHDAVLKSAKEIAAPSPSAGRTLRIAK